MGVDTGQEPEPASGAGGDQEDKAWLSAVGRGDRGAFDTIVRHTQERLAGHLLGALRLSREQALELTEQSVLDALETVGRGNAIESPLARLFSTARGRLRERLGVTFGDIPGLDVAFDPEPDDGLLRAFYDGDRGVERQLIHRRNLPLFLELMYEAVQSLPTPQRTAVRARWSTAEDGELDWTQADGAVADQATRGFEHVHTALYVVAGALLLTHARPGPCAVLDEHLGRAEWQPGQPFTDQVRQRVMYHIDACADCAASHQRAVQRVRSLPPLVLCVALRLDEQRRAIMDTSFNTAPAADNPPAVAHQSDHGTDPAAATTVISPEPAEDERRKQPRRPERPRRRVAAAVIALALLGLGLGTWYWSGADTEAPAPLGIDGSPAGGPTVGDPSQTPAATGGDTTPASQSSSPSPSTTAATATPTATGPVNSPSADPTATAANSDADRRPGTPTPATPSTQAPTRRLVISLSPLSSGAIDVTISGRRAGACADPSAPCAFSVKPGDAVTLDPVDVALSWGSGPCAGTGMSANCVFTVTADSQVAPWVLRLSG
jgi:hypothetical protein